MIKFLGFLKRKVFSSVQQFVSLFERFKSLRFRLSMLEFLEDISIFSIESEQEKFRGTYTYIY